MDLCDLSQLNRPFSFEAIDALLDQIQLDDLPKKMAELCSVDKKSFAEVKQLVLEQNWSDTSSRQAIRWSYIFDPLFSEGCDDASEFLNLYINLLAVVSSEMGYRVHSSARNWVNENSHEALSLLKLLCASSHGSELVTSCFTLAAKVDFSTAFIVLSELISVGEQSLRNSAIQTIGVIKVEQCEQRDNVAALLNKFLSSGDEVEVASAVYATFQFDSDGTVGSLVDTLERLISTDSSRVRCAIIHSWSENKGKLKNILKPKAVNLLGCVPVSDNRSVNELDFALYNLNQDRDRDLVLDVLKRFFSQKDVEPNLNTLSSTANKLSTNDDALVTWYAVQLLLTGDDKLSSIAADFFPPLSDRVYIVDLSEFSLTDCDVSFLARKVFAYLLNDHGPAVSILAACLEACSEAQSEKVAGLILDFWLYNYPGDIELFQKVESQSSNYRRLLKLMATQVEETRSSLRNLATNKALTPGLLERRTQAEIEFQRNRLVQKSSQKGGLIDLICQKNILLYGSASLNYINVNQSGMSDSRSQLTHLQTHSWSMKLPRMLKLSPAWFEYLVWNYRTEKRPDATTS